MLTDDSIEPLLESIEALEDDVVVEYNSTDLKRLVSLYQEEIEE